MRRSTSALTAAVLGTALSATMLVAQQAPPDDGSGMPDVPASVPGIRASRGARYLLRNGWDYLKYQEYERALSFFREAEAHKTELNEPERQALAQGIDRARRGMRDATEGGTAGPSYAKSGPTKRPGAMAVARPVQPTSAAPAAEPIQLTSGTSIAPASRPSAADGGLPALPASPSPTMPESRRPPVQAQAPAPASDPSAPPPLSGPPADERPAAPPTTLTLETPSAPAPASVPPAREVAQTAMPSPEPPAAVDLDASVPLPPLSSSSTAPGAPAEPPPASPAPPEPPPAAPAVPALPETTEPTPLGSVPAANPVPAELPPSEPAAPPAQPEAVPAPVPASAGASLPTLPEEAGPSPASPPVPPANPGAVDEARMTPPRPGSADGFIPERSSTSPSSLSPELQREVDRIAQKQDEESMRRPLPPDREPPAGAMPGPSSPTTRLEITRAPSPTEARPIRAIPVPDEFVPLSRRDWQPNRKYWSAAATCHLPLYFQDASLERYGHSTEQFFGPIGRYLSYPVDDPRQSIQRNQITQPIFSIGLFAAQIALLPYNMVMDPPWEAEYDLGYYRPGDRVPTDMYYLPLTGVGPPLHGKRY